MKVSTRGRYALRLMIDLAEHGPGEVVPLKDISKRQDISTKYLEHIVTLLCKAGFLKSIRGSQGGYMLTKEPNKYTVGAILRVTEGSLSPVTCIEERPNQCERSNNCPTVDFWKGLNKVINDYADKITLTDLVNRSEKSIQSNYII